MSKLPPPPNRRPHRKMHEPGHTLIVTTDAYRHDLRQVGHLGQSGAFYSLDENPMLHEAGGWAPLYFIPHSDRLDDLGLQPTQGDGRFRHRRIAGWAALFTLPLTLVVLSALAGQLAALGLSLGFAAFVAGTTWLSLRLLDADRHT
ncbi:hypothetical protein ACPCDX_29065 [Streptomyces koyangensis]|uniref:hypothetical protein n=1 Tax=Streptomyces koyangensis TaxID=188770 RepID=UPI003C30AAC4